MSHPTTSRSPSPPPQPQDPLPPHDNDALDDVWGSPSHSSPSSPSLLPTTRTGTSHYQSDIHHLQREHENAGYRDGITAAKAGSAQAGFDEGFGLGAVLGARTGRVLGVLEGIARAAAAAAVVPGDDENERERMRRLWEGAGRELDLVRVFGDEYWTGEGVWKYEVTGAKGEGEEEIVFADVAGAHPLIRKWEGVMEGEATRWGVDLQVHEGWEEVRTRDGEGGREREDGKSVGNVKEKKVLDW
ncbi:hypothetical protein GE09DRAFT_1214501 [Coniochaeta sp. 2T2.1]|nr:hypothetical protein GE09DRAFT_1214501 [Coniochaeta sp. 2T2.1]